MSAPHTFFVKAESPAVPHSSRPHTLTGSRTRRSFQLMARGLAAEKKYFTLGIIASVLFGGLTVAVSQVLGAVTDSVVIPALEGKDVTTRAIWLGGAALAGVALALALSVAGRRIFAGIGVSSLQARHRRDVTRQYMRLPMSWHRAHPAGQLLSNANADAEAATGVFNPLPFALGVVVMLIVAGFSLFRIDVWLAIAAFTVLPIAVAANVVFQRHMSPAITHAQQLRAEVSDVAHESFEAALLVKSLGTEAREEDRFRERAFALRDANIRVGIVRALFDPVIDLLPSVGTLLILGVGTFRIQSGAVETGEVVAAAYLLTMMAVPVRAFGWVLGELPRGLVGFERVSAVLDAQGFLTEGTTDAARSRVPGARITMSGVGVDAATVEGDISLLTDINLEVPAGQTVAIVGSTGAGKTTLVSLLARLSDPSAGRIELDGVDLRDLSPSALTRDVALVSQSTFIFEDSIRDNVTLMDNDDPARPDDDAVWAALRDAHVADVVEALPDGLDAPLGERGANLSGGQRQRLAIARALVRRPRLLVLDDATSAVDPGIEQAILASLRAQGQGATVVMVAYRMSSVALADSVIHIEGGRIVDVGTHAQLLDRDPGFADLANAYADARGEEDR